MALSTHSLGTAILSIILTTATAEMAATDVLPIAARIVATAGIGGVDDRHRRYFPSFKASLGLWLPSRSLLPALIPIVEPPAMLYCGTLYLSMLESNPNKSLLRQALLHVDNTQGLNFTQKIHDTVECANKWMKYLILANACMYRTQTCRQVSVSITSGRPNISKLTSVQNATIHD